MLAVITGATDGIGKAIAIELANAGFRLAFIARSGQKAEDLVNQVTGVGHFYLQGDHTDSRTVDRFCTEIRQRFGGPDLIINNAGVYQTGMPCEMSESSLLEMLEQNFWHAFRVTQPWLADFKQKKRGKIVFIGSIVSKETRPEAAAYSLSKSLLDNYARLLAAELRDYEIPVTRIIPGSVNTASWTEADVPRELFVQPEDISKTIAALLSLSPSAWVEEIVIRPLAKNW